MIDVKIYLKSKRKPIVFSLETIRQKIDLLSKISAENFVNVGCVTIATDDISHIIFENSK